MLVRTLNGVKILDSCAGLRGVPLPLSFCLFTTGPSRVLETKEEDILSLTKYGRGRGEDYLLIKALLLFSRSSSWSPLHFLGNEKRKRRPLFTSLKRGGRHTLSALPI